MRGETLLQGRTRCGRNPSGRTASDLASRIFGALALTTMLAWAVFWAGTAQATIVKNSTIAASQAAAFDEIWDPVGALFYTSTTTGGNTLGGTTILLAPDLVLVTGHSANFNGNGSTNPRVVVGDRNLLDGRVEIPVVETYFHPGYFAGCEQGRCIDAAIMRLATSVSGIEPITIGTQPVVGEMVLFAGFGRQGVFPDVTGSVTGQLNMASNRVDGYGPATGDSLVWPEYFGVSIKSTSSATDVPMEGLCANGDSGAPAGMYRNGTFEVVGMCVADLGGWNSAFLSLDSIEPWINSIVGTTVPEPGTALLMLLGVTGLAARARRH